MDKMNSPDDHARAKPRIGYAYAGLHQSFVRAPIPQWDFKLSPMVASADEVSVTAAPSLGDEIPPAPVRKPSQAPLPIIKAGTRLRRHQTSALIIVIWV